MSYEAGSKECRHLIEAKESLLLAMESLSNIISTDILQIQIKEIYNKLEMLHDKRKKIEYLRIRNFQIHSLPFFFFCQTTVHKAHLIEHVLLLLR